jgi:endoglucanase Acf2
VDELTVFLPRLATTLVNGDRVRASSFAFGALTPVIENHLNIKKRDFRSFADFSLDESKIYLKAKLSLSLWAIMYIGLKTGKHFIDRPKIRKAGN